MDTDMVLIKTLPLNGSSQNNSHLAGKRELFPWAMNYSRNTLFRFHIVQSILYDRRMEYHQFFTDRLLVAGYLALTTWVIMPSKEAVHHPRFLPGGRTLPGLQSARSLPRRSVG